jgi:hypothetical protein
MQIRRTPAALAAAAALALALSGCSSSKGTSGAAQELRAAASATASSSPTAAASTPVAGGADGFQSSPGSVTNGDVSPLVVPRQIISTATLTVEAKVVTDAVAAVERIALEVGGRIDAEKISSRADGGHDATLVVKVPPEHYTAAIDKLSAIGTQRALEQSTQDVTGNIADLESRAATEAKSIKRIQAFMDKAGSIKDLVILEGELTNREATMASETAQANALRGQAAMGTITATFVEPNVIPPAKPKAEPAVHHTGFSAGLHNGWHAFTSTVVVVLTVLGAFAPFAVPLGVVLAIWILVRRRRRLVAPPVPVETAAT